MDLTLIIPAYNEAGEIAECIEAACRATDGALKEILVVDNASTDETASVAASHGARVVRVEQKGLPFARLAGLAAAQTQYVAYIDAKHRLSDTWLSVAERVFASYPAAVALSGPRFYTGAPRWKLFVLDSVWYLAPIAYWAVGYMVLGGNFIARKDALQKVGIDTSVLFYGEDTMIAKRLSGAGKVMFRMDFFVYSSARRFDKEGMLRTNVRYAMNFLWPVLFSRPFTVKYNDVRAS